MNPIEVIDSDNSDNKRLEFVDELRGLAILFMVFVHAAATWQPSNISQTSFLGVLAGSIGGLAAPLFVTLFGWGLANSSLNIKKILIRASILFALQFPLNILASHLFPVTTPGILSLFALLYLTSPLWVKVKNMDMVLQICILISISLMCIIIPQGGTEWDSRIEIASILGYFSHLMLTGLYPLFPWIFFAILGSVLHASWDNNKLTILLFVLSLPALFISILQDRVWAVATDSSSEAVMTFFPANHWFLFNAGLGVTLLWIMASKSRQRMSLLASLGQISLTVYLLHFIPLNYASELDNQMEWSMLTSIVIIIIFTLIWLPISLLFTRAASKYTIESGIKKLSR